MSGERTTKRSAEIAGSGAVKRLRVGIDSNAHDGAALDEDVSFVESMLAVPLDIIYYKGPGTRAKPLLTRAEAQCLVYVSLLAHEVDSLTAITAQVCEHRHVYDSFADKLRKCNQNQRLNPLLSILYVLGRQFPDQTLEKIRVELFSASSELRLVHANLKQYSEQNWALSESLLDAGPEGEDVAKGKRKLSDIQDELCDRISALLDESNDNGTKALAFPPCETMAAFCQRIMNRVEVSSPPRASQQSSVLLSVKGQTQESERSHLDALAASSHPPRHLEKENDDPSQQAPQQQRNLNVASPQEESPMSGKDEDDNSPMQRLRYGPETQYAADALSSLMVVARAQAPDGSNQSAK
ncbi:hypothetical protein MPSEU_000375900 [Mayamaea pseudoterrestris]|nr:hypothetical protein MPSEU_000375900 [Mayamaea pseudoterrestris]